jgi:hypothetical protein
MNKEELRILKKFAKKYFGLYLKLNDIIILI